MKKFTIDERKDSLLLLLDPVVWKEVVSLRWDSLEYDELVKNTQTTEAIKLLSMKKNSNESYRGDSFREYQQALKTTKHKWTKQSLSNLLKWYPRLSKISIRLDVMNVEKLDMRPATALTKDIIVAVFDRTSQRAQEYIYTGLHKRPTKRQTNKYDSRLRIRDIAASYHMIPLTDSNIVKKANDGNLKIIGYIELDLSLDEITVRHVLGVSSNHFCDCLLGIDFL
ncbi:hypothetical protein RF11_06177 [Thelohanellus kitauei]|uniref:Uncharacterized protein n=1 Tax=Thelohanellus kitauei TaxID=669202 RepID=A0A0C2MPU9_THEKT|nr:hypothetical protein RF11_06177 [Thelohanellus kitauei]